MPRVKRGVTARARHKKVLEQAKGYLARAAGVDVEQAFGMIRRYARATQRSLSQVADDVARDDVPLADLVAAGAS